MTRLEDLAQMLVAAARAAGADAADAIALGGAWATIGQEVQENTRHREQVKGLPEQVQRIAAASYYRDCIDDGTPREICRCERETLTQEEPNFRRCDLLAERLIRDGSAERVQVRVDSTGRISEP